MGEKELKKLILIPLLLLCALAQPEFQKFQITTDVGFSHVFEQIEITLNNNAPQVLSNFSYTLAYDPELVYTEINGDKVQPEIIKAEDSWKINLPLDLAPQQTAEILLRFSADHLVQGTDNSREFRFRFNPQYHTKEFRLRVVLPAGSVLAEKKSAAQSLPVVFPDAAISTDGRRISVEWNQINLNKEEVYLMSFETPAPIVQASSNWWIMLVPVLFVVALVYSMHVRWKSTIQALEEDERKVLWEIRNKQGIQARELVARTGHNKVKIFRVTQRLERKGLIKIVKVSNRTRIYISDKLKRSTDPKEFILSLFSPKK